MTLDMICASALLASPSCPSIMVGAKGEMPCSRSLGGQPTRSAIFSSWFIVDEPGKMGLPRSISPRMQPTAHMSTPKV